MCSPYTSGQPPLTEKTYFPRCFYSFPGCGKRYQVLGVDFVFDKSLQAGRGGIVAFLATRLHSASFSVVLRRTSALPTLFAMGNGKFV